ncbi:hypothetical protein [Psychromonas hadalis]|uniref:hypothetical protein n=1 Tax=Psychromonas hadalis TaxID=211669 RepID=UPI000420D67C|nr:hypothetical protein [Psychromonas hadalis]
MKHTHLPHIDNLTYYQFITFRTYDSTDSFVAGLATKSNRKLQLAMDEYLDCSLKGAYLKGNV